MKTENNFFADPSIFILHSSSFILLLVRAGFTREGLDGNRQLGSTTLEHNLA
jgi:hypothetical protein